MATATTHRPPEIASRSGVTPSDSDPDSRALVPEDSIETFRFGLPTEWVIAAQILTGCVLIALSGGGGLIILALVFLGFGLTAPFRLADQPNLITVSGVGNLDFRLPFERLTLPALAIETLTRTTYTDSEGGIHHRMDIQAGGRELRVSVWDQGKAERFIASVTRVHPQFIVRGAWTSE